MLVAITIIGNACVSAGSQPARTGHFFADTFLSTINVECSRWVSDTACLDFMLAFQWPLSIFQVQGEVTFLTKPSLHLAEGVSSYVLFNVNNTGNWSVNIAYRPPNKPGFSLVISHDEEKGEEGTAIVEKSETLSMSLSLEAEPLPCPGSPLSSECTMMYFPIVLRYTGMNDTFSK